MSCEGREDVDNEGDVEDTLEKPSSFGYLLGNAETKNTHIQA